MGDGGKSASLNIVIDGKAKRWVVNPSGGKIRSLAANETNKYLSISIGAQGAKAAEYKVLKEALYNLSRARLKPQQRLFLKLYKNEGGGGACVRAQGATLRILGHSTKEIAKRSGRKPEDGLTNGGKDSPLKTSQGGARPTVLANCARKLIEKTKYKRNNSTKKISKDLQQNNISFCNTTVWT
ncbi:predicted protein [Nematostella vectensis]|uniref:Uncharacterized protein n=1 Tax=Nematostella vectensis TaxID=45351 RepID=A7SWI8_NEMVE|nr:predicted protein [Nematostella vectensis]|eukprot:XP_001624041.1 predicted protein [Nematostella vectensis]